MALRVQPIKQERSTQDHVHVTGEPIQFESSDNLKASALALERGNALRVTNPGEAKDFYISALRQADQGLGVSGVPDKMKRRLLVNADKAIEQLERMGIPRHEITLEVKLEHMQIIPEDLPKKRG